MASEYWVAIERKRRQSGAVAGSMAGDYQFVPRYVHAVQVVRDMPEPESVCGRYKYPIQGLVQRPWVYQLVRPGCCPWCRAELEQREDVPSLR
jgi:hypothetical protein